MDSLIRKRRDDGESNGDGNKVISALLSEMDGRRKNVYVLANTNVPQQIGKYLSPSSNATQLRVLG